MHVGQGTFRRQVTEEKEDKEQGRLERKVTRAVG